MFAFSFLFFVNIYEYYILFRQGDKLVDIAEVFSDNDDKEYVLKELRSINSKKFQRTGNAHKAVSENTSVIVPQCIIDVLRRRGVPGKPNCKPQQLVCQVFEIYLCVL